jgi:hypothetical protein
LVAFLIEGILTERILLPDDQLDKSILVDYIGNSNKFQSNFAWSSSSNQSISIIPSSLQLSRPIGSSLTMLHLPP